MAAAKVFIVSDALGGTAERVYRAASVQFTDRELDLERVTYVRTPDQVDRLVATAASNGRALILYTLVEEGLRAYMALKARDSGLLAIDVLGPVLSSLSHVLGARPSEIPGLTHRADSNYYARVEAADFAVRFDDGKNPKAIVEADLVLIGVSRTSKTPLSLYLANRRLKVANVPIAPELPIPDLLYPASRKVVGLTIDPDLLWSVRRARLQAIGLQESSNYASQARIREELGFAQALFDRLGCPVVDVSHQAVEETAETVLKAWQAQIKH